MDKNLIQVANDKMEEYEKNSLTKRDTTFRALNIMDPEETQEVFCTFLQSSKKKRFDILFCFSVTMWIHLNYGDDGMKKLFQATNKWCRYLVLEPQPWKCYRTASRRMRRANKSDFQHLELIQSKCEKLFPFIIEECEVAGFKHICTFGETGWKRPIMLFKNIS